MKDTLLSRRVKYLLIPVFVVAFLQVGRPLPLWRYLGKRDFYFDFIFGIIITGLLWNYIQYTYRLLDGWLPWSRSWSRRAYAQFAASCVAPIFLVLGLYLGYMNLYYGNRFNINKSLLYEVDLIMIVMIIAIINLVLIVLKLANRTMQQPTPVTSVNAEVAPAQSETLGNKHINRLLVSNGSKYVLLDRSQIQLVRLLNGVPVAYMKDGSNSIINTPLNALAESLPDYFFQINRNTIVNLREVKGFAAEKSGKLILRLELEQEEDIIVSQNRSVEFKDRLMLV